MAKLSTGVRILHLLRPAMAFLPEIEQLERRIPLRDRIMWSSIVLLIFLIASQIPLYGLLKKTGDDPLYWARMIMATNRGTLMELGIGPIVTAGMFMQLFTGTKVIEID